jgi:hypothetical protein
MLQTPVTRQKIEQIRRGDIDDSDPFLHQAMPDTLHEKSFSRTGITAEKQLSILQLKKIRCVELGGLKILCHDVARR